MFLRCRRMLPVCNDMTIQVAFLSERFIDRVLRFMNALYGEDETEMNVVRQYLGQCWDCIKKTRASFKFSSMMFLELSSRTSRAVISHSP